ncbi:hypothetical protein Godav_003911 [Gossypium davidsonii]|uniref:Uncharacterized protein n=1 Tax=Gossypium davidsonii TaxID=34287 RepID=A0A7J8SJE5_GOSDV|nr:hypothetical protein [Gossypium davidsonii]
MWLSELGPKRRNTRKVTVWPKDFPYLFRDLTQFWNTAYSGLTFGKVDLVPTVEE